MLKSHMNAIVEPLIGNGRTAVHVALRFVQTMVCKARQAHQ